ncbi:MAG TPA: nitroreductase family protein, partial [Terrimicrobiaceae bacterium]|nr:nitroreductase family protein [Terrimicrobiaceae bacterium]
MTQKIASTDHPIHALLAERWSPYSFDDRTVASADICSLFEAARWAPSSYNEQPWSFIVARKEETDEHARLLS